MAQPHHRRDIFTQTVEQALEHFADNAWLGTNSSLAAPYFLGNMLDAYADSETATGRGRALRDILLNAAEQLPPAEQHLLKLSFFQRNTSLNNVGLALQLGYSEASYYRHRSHAIEALAKRIGQQQVPPLRPETPRVRAHVGRQQTFRVCFQILREVHTLAITGPGGIGKTTLGLALMEAWGAQRTFWFTLRPGLNDQLSSLVFALGYFLRGLGAANTWRQLVADQGVLKLDAILGLIRHDLATLKHDPPLLCVDELDLLQRERNEHAQILHLLEELRDTAPLVLLSQRLVVEPYQHQEMTGLTAEEVALLLTQLGVTDISPLAQRQLSEASGGNPALLTLLVTLYQAGEPVVDTLAALAVAPSLELLLQRVWKRLEPDEREMLMALAVFRTFAPQDAWLQEQSVLEQLFKRQLVATDGHGGVAVLPYIRDFVYQRTPADLRLKLHWGAAQIREIRGEYTAAAYHYVAAQQPALGVWVWFNHRAEEIGLGRGAAALVFFKDITYASLSDQDDRRALAILRAELLKLAGTAEEAEAELQSVTWSPVHPITPYVQQLYGDLLSMQEGRQVAALEHYRTGLQLLADTAQLREIDLLTRRGYIYTYLLRDWEKARQEALLARLKAEDFYGNVEEEAGNYSAARAHYEAALAISEGLPPNLQVESRIHSNLGRLTWRQGDPTAAIMHLEHAMQCDEVRGDLVGVMHDQVNLSGAYIVAGLHTEALEQASSGLQIAESMRHSYLSAGLATNAAEACYYLRRLDEAEHYAIRALQHEEEVHRPYALTVLGLVQGGRGQFDKAERSFYSAIESALSIRDKYAEAATWRALGGLYGAQQDVMQTKNALEQALRLYDELGLSKEAEEMRANISEQKITDKN